MPAWPVVGGGIFGVTPFANYVCWRFRFARGVNWGVILGLFSESRNRINPIFTFKRTISARRLIRDVYKFPSPVFINSNCAFVLTKAGTAILFTPDCAPVGKFFVVFTLLSRACRAQNTCVRERDRPRFEDIFVSRGTDGKLVYRA